MIKGKHSIIELANTIFTVYGNNLGGSGDVTFDSETDSVEHVGPGAVCTDIRYQDDVSLDQLKVTVYYCGHHETFFM